MKALGRFDTALQMFVEEERNVDPNHLAFQKWLVEHGRMAIDFEGEPDPPSLSPVHDLRSDPSLR